MHHDAGAAYAFDVTSRESACRSLHFPSSMLRDLERVARTLGRDSSWCLRMAWSIACGDIADARLARGGQALLKGRKHATRVELPVGTWLHIALEAESLGRSHAWILQRAWLIASPRLSKLSR